MNILLLGNGFDLAHGLPTRYTDFLEWVKAEYALYVSSREQKSEIVAKIKEVKVEWAIVPHPSKISVKRLCNEEMQLELWECINHNFWLDYFLNTPIYQKENWIDFESEISKIVRSINDDINASAIDAQITILSNDFLKNRLTSDWDNLFKQENEKVFNIKYAELRDILLSDLEKLIRALEIYLTEYIEKMETNLISLDILNVDVQKVLNFNYTDTYENIYGKNKNIEYDYIHGKADSNNTLSSNNMVLGIDEYLTDERKNRDTEFIAFKKFYQRIHKRTGNNYKNWVEAIIRDNGNAIWTKRHAIEHLLYVFGHSLDMTDGDVLRELILCDNIYTKIYYLDDKVYGKQIENLVKVIGQDELIRRTGGKNRTIEFVHQKDMVKVKKDNNK